MSTRCSSSRSSRGPWIAASASGVALGRAQQVEDDGDVGDQLQQRAGPVGVGERRLDPGRLDRRQPLLAAAGPAHRPALAEQPLPQHPATAAATDYQRPRQAEPLGGLERAAAAQPQPLVFGDLRPAGRPRSSRERRGGGASRSAPPSSGGCRRSRSGPRPRASGSASSRPDRRRSRVEVADEQQHADHEGSTARVPRTNSTQHQDTVRSAMPEAYVVDAIRTPMGSYRGALSGVRPDDLAAHTIRAVVERTGVDPERIVDVYFGAANQSGEDNRDVARMAALLAGLPSSVPGATVNRLCASGLEAINAAARAVKLGEGDFYLAGGVESMSRAPWVVEKPERALPRGAADDARHDPGLADDQPAHGRARRLDRVDGRDRRERRRALRDQPRGPGRLRPAQPPARRRRRRGGQAGRGDRPDRGAAGPRDGHRRRRRGPPPRRLGSRSWRSCARSSARAAPSPPATPRPSTTAPPAC